MQGWRSRFILLLARRAFVRLPSTLFGFQKQPVHKFQRQKSMNLCGVIPVTLKVAIDDRTNFFWIDVGTSQ